ncbi:MAG TPA: hypothetical protein VHW96_15510 [Solirubrobacteraceae bacterium]|nr:hypothetical protein [Solirubrobacteraceae bacterium]
MGTLVRLYVGWRLLRLLRPILGAAAIAAALLALYSGHVAVKTPTSSPLLRGAATAQHDLSRALKRAFEASRR